MFLAPPPIGGPVVVVMPLGLEPGGRPDSGGVFVAVPERRDGKSARPLVGEEPNLPEVDPPDRRFDVAIEIFERAPDLGLASGDELPALLHRLEGLYLALELQRSLEDSGHWGTVRVVPTSGAGFDVVVSARVDHSSRERLEIEVQARNALGRRLDPQIHRGEGAAALREPMEGIASDLVRWRDQGPLEALSTIRAAALLQFGASLAPDVFGRYPSAGADAVDALDPQDPRLQRLRRIQDRDQTFLTILNRHYKELHDVFAGPYGEWRSSPRSAGPSAQLAQLEAIGRSFSAPGPPSVVKAEGYEKMLAGSVEGQFLAWRRLARRALSVENAFIQ